MSENRVALVTGAGSGVGQAAAVALSKAGYDLVISGRRAEKLDETAAATGAGDERILKHQCDVGDPEAVRLMFDACVDRFGRLDVLFNNAGTGAPPVPLDELTPARGMNVF